MSEPPEEYVFISYAHEDRGFVDRLARELEGAGIDVWYDRGLRGGRSWSAELETYIENADAVIVVLSAQGWRDRGREARAWNMGGINLHRGARYREAEDALRRALAIRERVYGPEHRSVALSLGHLGVVLHRLGKEEEALQFFKRAFRVSCRSLGPDHRNTKAIATWLKEYGISNPYSLLVPKTGTVEDIDHLPKALQQLDLPPHRPVLVLVGGAGYLENEDALESLFTALARVAEEVGAIVVDGGTDAGVMCLMGRARAATRGTFPLVGVAPRGRVRLPDEPPAADDDRVPVEPHHTHLILVPGNAWGDESPYLARVATLLAGNAPSVTVLVNGGEVARQDVEHSLAEGRPVIVVAGTGRLADELAAAADRPAGVRVVGMDEAVAAVRACLLGDCNSHLENTGND